MWTNENTARIHNQFDGNWIISPCCVVCCGRLTVSCMLLHFFFTANYYAHTNRCSNGHFRENVGLKWVWCTTDIEPTFSNESLHIPHITRVGYNWCVWLLRKFHFYAILRNHAVCGFAKCVISPAMDLSIDACRLSVRARLHWREISRYIWLLLIYLDFRCFGWYFLGVFGQMFPTCFYTLLRLDTMESINTHLA